MAEYSLRGEQQGEEEQEEERGEQVPEEESKLSRLFYLQLYSSVLNAEKAHKKREKERRRKEKRSERILAAKKRVKSLSWMDVTNLLARSFSTEGSARDKDIGDVQVPSWSDDEGRELLHNFSLNCLSLHLVSDQLVATRTSWWTGG